MEEQLQDLHDAAVIAYIKNAEDNPEEALEYVVAAGDLNPLTAADINARVEKGSLKIEHELMANFKHTPYQKFLSALSDELDKPLLSTGEDNAMQYEANYLNALMTAYPDVLERTMRSYQDELEEVGFLGDNWEDILENIIFPWSE